LSNDTTRQCAGGHRRVIQSRDLVPGRHPRAQAYRNQKNLIHPSRSLNRIVTFPIYHQAPERRALLGVIALSARRGGKDIRSFSGYVNRHMDQTKATMPSATRPNDSTPRSRAVAAMHKKVALEACSLLDLQLKLAKHPSWRILEISRLSVGFKAILQKKRRNSAGVSLTISPTAFIHSDVASRR
jgi:hypothetical protein